MRRTTLFALVFVGVLAAHSMAGLDKFQLPAFSPTQQMNVPAVAVGPDGWTMVAYSTSDVILMNFIEVQAILTRDPGWPVVVPDPVTLGPGYGPWICWTREGWICAFSSAGRPQAPQRPPPRPGPPRHGSSSREFTQPRRAW